MKALLIILSFAILSSLACGSDSETPNPTPDIEATVQARVSATVQGGSGGPGEVATPTPAELPASGSTQAPAPAATIDVQRAQGIAELLAKCTPTVGASDEQRYADEISCKAGRILARVATEEAPPTPVAASKEATIEDNVVPKDEIRSFSQQVLAIEAHRNLMASLAAEMPPVFRDDLAQAYISGAGPKEWSEGIRSLRNSLASLPAPDDLLAVKEGLLKVYDSEIQAIRLASRLEYYFGRLHIVEYWAGFYPSVTFQNFASWGAALIQSTSNAAGWVEAQQMRASVYLNWSRVLSNNVKQ